MKIGLLGILLVWLSVSVLAADSDLVGLYKCEGTNPEGDTYSGFVEIRKFDRRFHWLWRLPASDGDGWVENSGIGIIVDGRVSVAYVAGVRPDGVPVAAIVVYSVTTGAPFTLEGQWAVPHSEGIHQERLTKLPKDHPVPVKPEKPPPDRTGEVKG